jgi:hypothetical protein
MASTILKQKLVDYALRKAGLGLARADLEKDIAKLDEAGIIECDLYLVKHVALAYTDLYEVKVTAEKAEKNGVLSLWTVKCEDKSVERTARVALNYGRNALTGKGNAKSAGSLTDTLVKKAKSTKPETRAEVREAAYAALAALIAEGDGKTRDRVKQLMHLAAKAK